MWRCRVLAAFWKTVDMLGIGQSMLDGSYYREDPDPPAVPWDEGGIG